MPLAFLGICQTNPRRRVVVPHLPIGIDPERPFGRSFASNRVVMGSTLGTTWIGKQARVVGERS